MKWFLIPSACLVCSATLVRGDAAADLYNKAIDELNKNQFDLAAKDFDTIITSYPTNAMIDDVRLRSGLAYLYGDKFTDAISHLAKSAAADAKPQYRQPALYFTALAQFSLGQKGDKNAYRQCIATVTTLADLIAKAPVTPENKVYLESAVYYRALANFEIGDFAASEKDLILLTTGAQFAGSLTKPDYLLRLGAVYATQTNQAVTDKKPEADIQALAAKAIDTYDQVSRDPNALVQANDANMSKAQVLILLAQLDPSGAGYQKALEAYRLVRRKDDLIPKQQERIEQLRKQVADAIRANPTAISNPLTPILSREQNRLADLQDPKTPDPIIQALIGIAQCYVNIPGPDGKKESDEARTILHRLQAHATLTPEQQQTVDFQNLYSYVLGGQTDAADKALDDYLGKHKGDAKADFISYSIAAELMKRKDYAGTLKQAERSLREFPNGTYAANALALEAEALNKLGRQAEADKLIIDYTAKNPSSTAAVSMYLTKAQTDTAKGDLAAALEDYKKVRDNPAVKPEVQAGAAVGYIQTLNSLQKYDDVIAEAKAFQTKYPSAKSLASVLLFEGMAMDQKKDPAAVTTLQDIARKYPQEEAAPFALSYVITIYQKAGAKSLPLLIQAVKDLQKAYPESYQLLVQAADTVSTELIKNKKFDDAIALYTPLLSAPKPDIAASARNKIGGIWLAEAKAMGSYTSLPLDLRTLDDQRLGTAEGMYVETLKTAPNELSAVGDAFDGLRSTAKQRRSWGQLKDTDLEAYMAKVCSGLTEGDMPAHVEMAKAGLVFMYLKDGAKGYPAALDRFKKVVAANPSLRLTRQESVQFGDLLIAEKSFDAAIKVYNDLLQNASANDRPAQGDAYYGLGAAALAQGKLAEAKGYFLKLKALPGGGLWHPHISEANFGVALADEQSGTPADINSALQTYGQLMQSPVGGVVLQAKAMLGYGRLLEKGGFGVKPSTKGPGETAVHYYQQPHTLFGPACPHESAEGLYNAGQTYDKAGDKANAKKMYDDLLKNYATSAPEWASKVPSP